MKSLNQQGILHIGLLIGLVVVAVIAFAGYRVLGSDPASESSVSTSSSVPAEINSEADLTQTSKALDQTDAELDSGLDDAALDSDIDAML